MSKTIAMTEAWSRHERTVLNLNAQRIRTPVHPTRKNLWKELKAFGEKFVVDNHIPWEEFACSKGCSHIAFILGTSVLNELARPIRVFEDHSGIPKAHRNVFLFFVDLEGDLDGRML